MQLFDMLKGRKVDEIQWQLTESRMKCQRSRDSQSSGRSRAASTAHWRAHILEDCMIHANLTVVRRRNSQDVDIHHSTPLQSLSVVREHLIHP